jgi:hypothetical protein
LQYSFGVIIFDDPKAPKGGWASISGDQAVRIDSTASLSTDVVWLCNLKYEEFYRISDLSANPWMRYDGYLPIKINDMLSEWGNDPEQTERDEMAMFVSELWSRIMQITMRLIKKNSPHLDDEEVFTGRSLQDDLRALLPPAEYPKDEAGGILRLGIGYVNFTKIVGRPPKGAKIVVLKKPRLDHAINMLTTPIPVGPFDLHQGRDLPSLNDLVNSKKPVLANIVIRRFADTHVHEIYAFGSQMGSGKRIPRTWVPQPELAVLSAVSTVEVQNAFIGKSYSDMASGILDFIRSFLESGDSSISWSCGIIAEALWRASSLGLEKRDSMVPTHEQPQTSWRGAWVNTADKVATFLMAMKMTRAGYFVGSYGYGTLYCWVPPERKNDIVMDAWKNGLLPSMRDIATPVSREKLASIPWGGEPRSRLAAEFIMTKKQEIRWEMDKIPLVSNEEKKRILQVAAAQLR